jgi:hypothetical protein
LSVSIAAISSRITRFTHHHAPRQMALAMSTANKIEIRKNLVEAKY